MEKTTKQKLQALEVKLEESLDIVTDLKKEITEG